MCRQPRRAEAHPALEPKGRQSHGPPTKAVSISAYVSRPGSTKISVINRKGVFMNCCFCQSDLSGQPDALAFLSFGAVRTGTPGKSKSGEQVAQRILAEYLPLLAFSLRMQDWNPAVEITGSHAQLPQPPIVAFQSEFTFCSTACMRRWLSAAVDLLESLRDGVLSGSTTNACRINPPLGHHSAE